MNASLLILVSTIYVGIAIGYFTRGEPGMGVAFLGYAAANGGFLWELYR